MRSFRTFSSILLTITAFVVCCLHLSSCDDNPVNDARNIAEDIYYPYHQEDLPRDLLPEFYKVFLKIDLEKHFDFCGEVTIDLNCVRSTKYVILHSKDLAIFRYSLFDIDDSSRKLDLLPMKKHLEYEQILFETKEELVSGKKYRLVIAFKGSMIDIEKGLAGGLGILRESYVTDQGKKRNIGYSVLSPNFARRAFPCFDEPDFKAKFVLTIVHDKHLNAVTNSPLKKRVQRNSYLDESTFEPTVNTSTYIVMFAVTDFVSSSTITPRGTKIIVWGRKAAIKNLQSLLEPAANFVTYYEKYTDVNYPYPELNIMGFTKFPSPGFEGYGLLIGKETSLFWNNLDETKAAEFGRVANLPHELAHKWFGGLVTIREWDQIWLYQGIAQFFAFKSLEHYNSTYRENTWICFLKRLALKSDGNEASPSMNQKRKLKLGDIFNRLAYMSMYNKGASIFYMLEKLMGKEAFKKGIRIYMKRHLHKNANVGELWDALQSTGPSFDIKTVMHGWEYQRGFPLINIKYAGKDSNGKNIYTATQSTYVKDLDENDPKYQKEYKGIKWYVPLWYSDSSSPHKTNFIWMNETSVNITVPGCVKWIKANAGEAGFYRVNYTQEIWANLTQQLNDYHEAFSEEDRFGLIDNSWNFAWSNKMPAMIPLKLTTYLYKETKWCTIKLLQFYVHEGFAKEFRYKPNIFNKLAKYMQRLLLNSTWDDQQFKSNLYVIRFSLLAYYGEQSHIKECLSYIEQWMDTNRSELFGRELFGLRQIIYETAVRFGNESHWEFLRNQLDNLTDSREDQAEKYRLEEGLASTQSSTVMHRWLNEDFDNKKNATKTEMLSKLAKLSKYSPGREEAWKYFTTNYDKIIKRDAQVNGKKTKSFLGFTSYFDDQNDLEKVEKFAKSKKKLWSLPATKASLDTIRSNIKWMKKYEKTFNDFLTEQVGNL